jgi:hypothetical protein
MRTDTFADQFEEITDLPPCVPTRRSPQQAAERRFPMVAFSDIKVDTSRRGYLVKGLIASTGIAVVWGPPKCGKSFWIYDVLLHVALGWPYRGRPVQQTTVVCIALEGQEGVPARIEGFRRHHEVTTAPFYMITSRLNLIGEVDTLVKDIRAQLGSVRPGVVCIDTLNRSLVGSESKDEDMGKYLAAADKLREELKCVVIIVHHCGIDASRPRGHTSLTGAVESQIAVKRAATGDVVATLEFAKDMPEGAEVFSRLEPMTIGKDPDGDAITTLVVVAADQPAAGTKTAKADKLAQMPRAGLRYLHECIADAGRLPPKPSPEIPGGSKGVTLDEWRRRLEKHRIINPKGNPRQQFQRIHVTLLNAGAIGIWEDFVWAVT